MALQNSCLGFIHHSPRARAMSARELPSCKMEHYSPLDPLNLFWGFPQPTGADFGNRVGHAKGEESGGNPPAEALNFCTSEKGSRICYWWVAQLYVHREQGGIFLNILGGER